MTAERTRRPPLGPFAAFAAFGVFWGAWAVLLPALRASTGASEGELGLALLSIGLGALPGMLGAGYLLSRFGDAVLPAALVAGPRTRRGPFGTERTDQDPS
jgi:sulfite exporter TauE/SafE